MRISGAKGGLVLYLTPGYWMYDEVCENTRRLTLKGKLNLGLHIYFYYIDGLTYTNLNLAYWWKVGIQRLSPCLSSNWQDNNLIALNFGFKQDDRYSLQH